MVINLKNKRNLIMIVSFLIVVIVLIYIWILKEKKSQEANLHADSLQPQSEEIEVVPTMDDQLQSDAVWCGTFQLVWNDMINELVKQDVKFENQPAMVDNLNKQDFNEKSISPKYYYKKFGPKSLKLKREIEKGIEKKFNEKSNVLDDIDWEDNIDERYIFYSMLKRDFTYKKEFSKLENGYFAEIYDDVKYFGIDCDTKSNVRAQVDVLYYDSEQDCAVILNTAEGDKVLLCKGKNGTTFNEIYQDVIQKSDAYTGDKLFGDEDILVVPEIDFNIKKEYTELENKKFYSIDNKEIEIAKAIQSLQLQMDQKGGTIKSEAVMDGMVMSAAPMQDDNRYFCFDDEYTIFLVENGKEKPYFAAHISDITKFQ